MAENTENASSVGPVGPEPHTEPAVPAPVYQLPEWETITHPPKQPRQSLLGRLIPLKPDEEDENRPISARLSLAAERTLGRKSLSGRASTLPLHNPPTENGAAAKGTLATALHARFDTAFPPHRKYFGRSRRFLFLCIILPAAIFLFVVVPLAVGLGVGLTRRSSSTSNLPLPSNTETFRGELTYYDPALGACGIESTSSEDIVSVSHIIFDAASQGSNPNANPLCGRKIRVSRDFVENGTGNHSVDVTVVDRCVGCEAADLDLSIAVFTRLAPEGSGRVSGNWAWLD
ncbi:RlpA-like double-psi beta-barrel-protein domain-containing protein-containing protein [Hypoxylon fragiforme]|uniref:RlpA-like double-psi beta-barrel-protein domain-containing protein-containing protein n=1 Tax=Hypoxylon fragiforme TaxID=63214 RepID=UPI0020C6856A|nr:RlpA-like double-psi beta-barrel-protein domain-containing protein-containing protein [Hypoxylon fragiforme]KAI2611734.1 RlpA-like double-psi beta-barrel-protein domain-containing protein-containing protein [Hypoxylon fragiforme]